MTEFECKGLWYLPEDKDRKVAGTLLISKKGNLRLSLIGAFRDDEGGDSKSHRIVLGSVDKSPKGYQVTLTGCVRIRQQVGSHFDSQEEYRASRGYFGAHLVEESHFLFSTFMVKLGGLTEWARHISGMNREPNRLPTSKDRGERVPVATYLVPTPPSGELSTGKITLNMGVSASSEMHAFIFREEANIYIELDEPSSAEKINGEYVFPFQNLMTLICDSPQEVESFTVWRTNSDDWNENPEIRVIGPRVHPDRNLEDKKTLYSHEMLFTLEDVEFVSFAEKWLRFSETHSKPFAIYFGTQYGPPSYIDMTYALFAQVLSLYYARTDAGKKHRANEEERFKEIFSRLTEKKDHDWLIDHLGVNPYPTFQSILQHLVSECGDALDPLVSGRRNDFVNRATATLQFIQRREIEGQVSASQGSELFWLMQKLRYLIKACFLKELGFPIEKISELFQRNEFFQHMCKIEKHLELERDHAN